MKLFWLKKNRGYALIMVLVIVSIAAMVAGSTLRRTYTVSGLNQRSKQYQSAMYAAEAAVERVFARFRYDYINGGLGAVSNNLSIYRTMVPTPAENSHWSNFRFSNAQGVNNQTYVGLTVNSQTNYVVLDGNYAGLKGWRGIYRVISNARPLTGINPASAGVQQEIALDTIPAFQFAIFFNGQLEFTQCAPLTVRGRTHANGPICMGAASGNTLSFSATVTTTSSIVVSNLGGYSGFANPVYNGTPKFTTGVPSLNLPIGTTNTPAAVREIIYPPPAAELVNSAMGQQRFHNKAGIVLLISNNNVTLNVKDMDSLSGISSNYTYSSLSNIHWPYFTNVAAGSNNLYQERANLAFRLPFLNLTNRFYDYRESKWVMPTQIDMGILKTWLTTNTQVLAKFPAGSGIWPTVMYVADFRSLTNLHAVRLTNGTVIPTNGTSHAAARGFTLATMNPLYVWGHYNLPNSAHQGTDNVSATFPASLISDSITVLSTNWQDSTYGNAANGTYGTAGLNNRAAANTTINAAIIAGTVFTTGTGVGNWSGGVHNMTRLLESWSGRTLTLNSSLVMLYNSAIATNQFKNPGTYYNAPNRNFNFNTNYLSEAKLPPKTPTVSVISRATWTIAPVNTVTYNGP
jgi:Tfp pilus assembly protein PilX